MHIKLHIKRLTVLSLCLVLSLLAACDQGDLGGFSGLQANIISFTADPVSIRAGESTTLRWIVLGGDEDLSITLTPGNVDLSRSGSYQTKPDKTTTYTLMAGSAGKAVTKEITVNVVGDPPTPEPPTPTPNQAPVISDIPDQTMILGDMLTIPFTITDDDFAGSQLGISLVSDPNGILPNLARSRGQNGTYTLELTPLGVGTVKLLLSIIDAEGLRDEVQFAVTVQPRGDGSFDPDYIGTFEFKPAEVKLGQITSGYLNLPDSVDCSISVNGAAPYAVDCVGEISFTPRELGITKVEINAFKASGYHIFLTGEFAAVTSSEATCENDNDIITFKDASFEKTIKAALDSDADVTCRQMASLTKLNIYNENSDSSSPYGLIEDITDLKYAVNLTELSLGNIPVPIEPLAKLSKLETIIFSHYLPDDFAALSELANLTSLYAYALPYGELDMSVLNDVPSLESITLWGYKDGFPSTILDLGGIVALPNLVYLDIDLVQLKNPQGLKTLTNLNSLNLGYVVDTDDKLVEIRFSNEVVEIISELARLETLNLSGKPVNSIYGEGPSEVKNFLPLANLKRLQSLTLNEGVTNLSFITELSQLTNLDLSANQIGDISPLLDLPWAASDATVDISFQNPRGDSDIPLIPAAQIEALSKVVKVLYNESDVDTSDPSVPCEARLITIYDDLLKETVYDTLGLDEADDLICAELKRLTSLDASFGITGIGEGIYSLSGLEYATNLIKLDLFSFGVRDFEPLSRLTKLEELTFGFGYSPSFELLSGLPRLRVLYLDSTGKANLSGIEALTSLEKLSLDLTDIEDISPLLELPWAGSNDYVSLQSVGDIPIEQIEALRQKVETVKWP